MSNLVIGGHEIAPGSTRQLDLPVVRLYTDTDISMPVHVIRARKPGPCVFVAGSIHGDEINGIEIIRRLIQLKTFKLNAGTLILAPIVNVYGVLSRSRYMPDRRDLNRSFPGSERGSLAARVADTFMTEIVQHCEYGIDLHTGAIHRSNLPQIRANLSDPETLELAQAFDVPVLINAPLREGTLREAAVHSDTKILLYEAGEALRFDELSIRAGVRGIQSVLAQLGMVRRSKKLKKTKQSPYVANNSSWTRANSSGIVTSLKNLGEHVEEGDALARIGSPFGETFSTVEASREGIIVGKQNIPLVQEGDAMFHIAYFSDEEQEIAEHIRDMTDTLLPESGRELV